MFSIYHATAWS